MLVAGLLLALAIALMYQYQSGLLTWEATQFVLKLASGFILLPGIWMILIVRSPLFQAIEVALMKSMRL